jgi:curved DNA-binding protein
MQPQNYYMLLGIDHRASLRDVRRAYRRLARQYHPDLHPNVSSAATMMRLLNEAVDVLSDATRRVAYDQVIERIHVTPQATCDAKLQNTYPWAVSGQQSGHDVTHSVTITRAESLQGTQRELRFHSPNGHPYVIPIVIAPGVRSGTRLLFKEMGGPGQHGGRRGDLYIDITIVDEP